MFALVLLIPAAPASAACPHTVQPGETLSSIAAANNLTTRTVAELNGVSEDHQVVLGSTIMVPTTVEGYASLQQAGLAPADPAQAAAPASQGSYTVQAGDTLSAIASRAGVSMSSLAAANGLDPNAFLLTGTVLSLAGGAAPSQAAATPAGGPAPQGAYTVRGGDTLSALAAQTGVSVNAMAAMNGLDPAARCSPAPSSSCRAARPPGPGEPCRHRPRPSSRRPARPHRTRVSAADIQNSPPRTASPPRSPPRSPGRRAGSTTAMVSAANARGVMQVMPGTWDYVQQNLAGGRQLDPNSANDNVHAGVMYLERLLTDAGGDENAAIAGYYQGLASVRERGLYDDTQQYVNNVQALRGRFGG